VLNQLDIYNAKATFFCIGRNVDKHPDIYKKIKEKGHAIGNHTYSHLKGWTVSTKEYIDDVELASHHINTKLFRPPYGKIKPSQIKNLKNSGYKLFMWDVLSEDYNQDISAGKCLQNVVDYTRNGSIIVFHDSLKASSNLKKVLPEILKKYTERGFIFQKLK
jgi:peptidoglycan/xylan/chitin deacetylase (PgdA/CDA1 family)